MTTHSTSLQTPTKTPSEFVPVEGGSDTTSAESLLIIAYIAMWLLFFGLLAMTQRRQKALTDKIDRLEQALERADSRGEDRAT
ncbi:MAG TPA: CcmD family protein [Polyangiaceae bacterium]|nr:CcmD family protein [Polyangiaceae bacterium]